MNKYAYLLPLMLMLLSSSCKYFGKDENEILIPEGTTQEQLQEQRYAFKHDKAYKEQFLHQEKTDSALITIFNVIPYQIKDETANVGEGFDYYIIDIGVDNFTKHPFPIASFTKSCHLTTSDTSYRFSNIGFALKMHSLQTDSSEMDLSYITKFYQLEMPAKELYRVKLFAYEVSKEEKDALIFHYKVGNQKYEYKIRDKQY
jgi:hypothetical protein